MDREKRIRDNVHGDIAIPSKFLRLIDTKEFQRLRFIRQLATANQVFPGAEHTRFEHSLGTFFVMKKLLDHFQKSVETPFLDMEEEDYNAVLVAALLHDIGHGPFSHVFEEVLEDQSINRSINHVTWSKKIIQDEESTLHTVLKEQFGEKFHEKVINFLDKRELIKRDKLDSTEGDENCYSDKDQLNQIYCSLISSQLDADRMDYILRDAHNVGVMYGRVDIDTLISGLAISVEKSGRYVICVNEKNLSDLEEYLYSRYQMYRNVYYHPYKLFTEALFRKIIKEAKKLYRFGLLPAREIPRALVELFSSAEITVKEYSRLDDHVVLGAICNWAELPQAELYSFSELCRSFLNHGRFVRVELHDYRTRTVERFRDRLRNLILGVWDAELNNDRVKDHNDPTKKKQLQKAIMDFENRDIKEMLFYIEKFSSITPYWEAVNPKDNPSKEPIYIRMRGGSLRRLTEVSPVIAALHSARKDNDFGAVYIHRGLLERFLNGSDHGNSNLLSDERKNEIMDKIDYLVRTSSARNHIEIENKYVIDDLNHESVHHDVIKSLSNQGYRVTASMSKDKPRETLVNECDQFIYNEQVDTYYDTVSGALRNMNCALRIREINGRSNYQITCKHPTNSESSGDYGQFERYEDEELTNSQDISDPFNLKFINYCLEPYISKDETNKTKGKFAISELRPIIRIKNKRTKLYVEKVKDAGPLPEIYEMVFDDVEYINIDTAENSKERQIEIEIKSDNVSRISMQRMANLVEKDLGERIKRVSDSKYERAWNSTNIVK